jgi:hypothetical protein
MTKRIAIIQGHPDREGNHLLHALADAYVDGAMFSGHEVKCIEVARVPSPPHASRIRKRSDADESRTVKRRHALGATLGYSIPSLARDYACAVEGLSRAFFSSWLRNGVS